VLIQFFDCANVLKHVHGSIHDEDLNTVEEEGQQEIDDSMKVYGTIESKSILYIVYNF